MTAVGVETTAGGADTTNWAGCAGTPNWAREGSGGDGVGCVRDTADECDACSASGPGGTADAVTDAAATAGREAPNARTGPATEAGGVLLCCRCSILFLCFLANRNPRAASVLTCGRGAVGALGASAAAEGAGTGGGAGEACRTAVIAYPPPEATPRALGISWGEKVLPEAGPRAMAALPARGSPTAATAGEKAAAADAADAADAVAVAAIAAAAVAPAVSGVAAAAAAAVAADMGGGVAMPVCCVAPGDPKEWRGGRRRVVWSTKAKKAKMKSAEGK